MSSVRQRRSYHVLVSMFIFALAPATEGMAVFLLKFRDRIPYINRKLKFMFCQRNVNSGRELGEGHTDSGSLFSGASTMI